MISDEVVCHFFLSTSVGNGIERICFMCCPTVLPLKSCHRLNTGFPLYCAPRNVEAVTDHRLSRRGIHRENKGE